MEKMALNKKGIRQLADDLIAHPKRYDQNTFGAINECGTVACLAGMCLWRKIGTRAYRKLVEDWREHNLDHDKCLEAAGAQLGVDASFSMLFGDIWGWPEDLQEVYNSSAPDGPVRAALMALQRFLPDGKIDLNPKAVHTRLPQLKALLGISRRKKPPHA
jgi:hypothetical protein